MAPKEKPKVDASPTPHLYDIGAEWLELDGLLFESMGELTPDIEAKLTALDLTTAAKVDGYYHYLSSQGARVEALKAESKKLTDRARIIANGLDRLKEYVLRVLEMAKRDTFEGKTHTLSRVKNGGVESLVLLVEEMKVPEKFTVPIPATYGVDKERLRAALMEARELERRVAAGERPPTNPEQLHFTDEERAAAVATAKLVSTGYRLGVK